MKGLARVVAIAYVTLLTVGAITGFAESFPLSAPSNCKYDTRLKAVVFTHPASCRFFIWMTEKIDD